MWPRRITPDHCAGVGAAMATGFEYVRRSGRFTQVVTFDSDGQHDPTEIASLLTPLAQGFDVVIGTRFGRIKNNFPRLRRVILYLSNIVTFLLFGAWTSDSQSGFRAFSLRAIMAIRLTTNRMEASSEFFHQIKMHRLKMTEVPISVRYTKYSLKKGQQNTDSFRVLVKLLVRAIR